MNETVSDVLDFGFDLLCAAVGFLCLFRCISIIDRWIDVFQRAFGG